MSKKLKISMVSYLNSKPFILGMELLHLMDEIELHLEVPSKTVDKLIYKEVDIALVPVAVLPQIKNVQIITDYCIGADGKVNSVYLFSDVPVHRVTRIHLDSHSRTSANLLKVLLDEYWQQDVEFIENSEVHKESIQGTTAALMIGDKAINHRNDFSYRYDLAEIWKKHTDLPFAFAVWISTTPISKEWEEKLNEAFEKGLQEVGKIAPAYQHQFPDFDIVEYLSNQIDFRYTVKKAKALELFLSKIGKLKHMKK